MTQGNFGEIRALVQQTPSAQTLDTISQWLFDAMETHPEWSKVEVLPYILDHLNRRWPDEARRLPYSWFNQLLHGEPHMESIVALCTNIECLTWGKLKPEHVQTLINVPRLTVKRLDLKWNFLGPAGLDPIWPIWTEIEHLNLAQNRIDDDTITRLANAPCFPKLKSLELWGNPLTDIALQEIVEHASGALEHLSIWKTGQLGCETLARATKFTNLKILDLSWTTPTADTLLRFTDKDAFPNLERLSLVGVKRSAQLDRAIDELKTSGVEIKA